MKVMIKPTGLLLLTFMIMSFSYNCLASEQGLVEALENSDVSAVKYHLNIANVDVPLTTSTGDVATPLAIVIITLGDLQKIRSAEKALEVARFLLKSGATQVYFIDERTGEKEDLLPMLWLSALEYHSEFSNLNEDEKVVLKSVETYIDLLKSSGVQVDEEMGLAEYKKHKYEYRIRALQGVVRGELSLLMIMQEAYHAEHQKYATSFAELKDWSHHNVEKGVEIVAFISNGKTFYIRLRSKEIHELGYYVDSTEGTIIESN